VTLSAIVPRKRCTPLYREFTRVNNKMAVKSLLLDIDGVLLRDQFLLNHIQNNCVKYVQAKLPTSKNPRGVNRILYMEHGHTARGLQNAFRIDVSDFNEKVYDKKLIEHLSEIIYGTVFQLEAKEIYEFTQLTERGAAGFGSTGI